jgi:hypothetical protein
MSITKVQSAQFTENNADSTIPKVFASSPVSGHAIIVVASYQGTVGTPTCGDTQSNSYSLIDSHYDSGDNQSTAIFYCGNIVGGSSFTVTVSIGASRGYRRLIILEYDKPLVVDKYLSTSATYGTGTDALTSGAVVTTKDGELIIGYEMEINTMIYLAAMVAGTDYVEQQNAPDAIDAEYHLVVEDRNQASAGSIAGTFTQSTGTYPFTVGVATFSEAAGGGVDTAKKRMSATHLLVPSFPMAILPD